MDFKAETEEESARKDTCTMLLLLKAYLLGVLSKLQEVQMQKRVEILNELASIVEFVMNKRTFIETMERALAGTTVELESLHLRIMRSDPHVYLNSPLINSLLEKIRNLEGAIRREYESCTTLKRA